MVDRDTWYQQDGAPPHNTNDVARYIYQIFNDRWFGNNGAHMWPPRSPDLTPLDFYLWGRVRNLLYHTPVTTKEDCIGRFRNIINNLSHEEVHRATHQGVEKRLHKCLEVEGHHFEQLK